MKVVLLAAGGRAGSDFFHSLIDGHPEILQFPGYLRVNKLKPILNYDTHIKIAKSFIKSFPEFFDSRNEKFERWCESHNRKVRGKQLCRSLESLNVDLFNPFFCVHYA